MEIDVQKERDNVNNTKFKKKNDHIRNTELALNTYIFWFIFIFFLGTRMPADVRRENDMKNKIAMAKNDF